MRKIASVSHYHYFLNTMNIKYTSAFTNTNNIMYVHFIVCQEEFLIKRANGHIRCARSKVSTSAGLFGVSADILFFLRVRRQKEDIRNIHCPFRSYYTW